MGRAGPYDAAGAPMSAIDALVAAGLSPLERAVLSLLRRLGGAEEVVLAGLLAVRALADGHTGLSLRDPDPRAADGEPLVLALPPADLWRAALAASPLVADGAADSRRPLVLRGDTLLLQRYDAAEARVAERLRALASEALPVDHARLDALIERMFPGDWRNEAQEQAVRAGCTKRLLVLAGGPGTGKTTTVVRLLAALVDQALAAGDRPPRCLLLAPTGKAAARLRASILQQQARLDAPPEVLAALPRDASTLHRALGPEPGWLTRFRHHADAPWSEDVVVVDETSMVDLPLLDAVLSALGAHARLILIGDPDQLPPVGTGAVLGDLCAAGGPVAEARVRLSVSRRFAETGGIGQLALAVLRGDAAGVVWTPGVTELHTPTTTLDRDPNLLRMAIEGWSPACRPQEPADRLKAMDRFRVLCALRAGPDGSEALNTSIELGLARAGLLRPQGAFYEGRPILITVNDPGLGLSNGDVGVLAYDAQRQLRAWFPEGDGLRAILPARLPPHETAFAMTVHKSQGSEHEHVVLALGSSDHRLLGRELLYTGLTRAKARVDVVGTPEAVALAIGRRTWRRSGMGGRLG